MVSINQQTAGFGLLLKSYNKLH